ncbi:hypothetical protein [Kineococcus sp. G2]|uniref:hypothetical protein n=1 Tax=Kineococcus sp. G2 TaxID=3127484 RepID=UPI00301B79A8
MNTASHSVRLALVSGAALLVAGSVGIAVAAGHGADQPVGDARTVPVAHAPADPAPVPVEGGEGYEGPGTDRVPVPVEGGEGYEGPGTERVPAPAPVEGGEGYEGPGTDRVPAPVERTVTPADWQVVVPTASVHAVPGDVTSVTGSISDPTAHVAGTGRVATVGVTDWVEVKVPGATTGWVVATALARL